MIFAGIDEAGYGPALGPLTVSAAAFEWDEDLPAASELYSGLKKTFPRITDSKQVFTPAKGLRPLEECIYPFVPVWFGKYPSTFGTLVESFTGNPLSSVLKDSPWFNGNDFPLPVSAEWAGPVQKLPDMKSGHAVSSIVNAPLFNSNIRQGFNKSTLLFSAVCGLIKRLMSRYRNSDLSITVDRLGGRKFYRRLLAENFIGSRIEVCSETVQESEYIMHFSTCSVRILFKVKADRDDFCTGLASLISKYLRELSMHMFNGYFRERSAGLRATQGYPQDAKRFLNDIQGLVTECELSRLVRLK